MDFTLIDGVVAIIIILSALLAYSRGFVREALAISGWIIATFVAFVFADQVTPLVRQVPVVGDFIGDSCELNVIASFAAIFAVVLVIASIFTPLFSSVIQRSIFGGLDQALGFVFGAFRGILLVAVGFFVYQTVLQAQNVEVIENSRAIAVFSNLTSSIENRDPEAALGWITTQYEQLVGECGTPTTEVEAAGTDVETAPVEN